MSTNAMRAEDSLRALAHPGKARTAAAYFKTGLGEYGEGDLFYGIRVPQVRELARQFNTFCWTTVQPCCSLPITKHG